MLLLTIETTAFRRQQSREGVKRASLGYVLFPASGYVVPRLSLRTSAAYKVRGMSAAEVIA